MYHKVIMDLRGIRSVRTDISEMATDLGGRQLSLRLHPAGEPTFPEEILIT
jgi:hypothetical protein